MHKQLKMDAIIDQYKSKGKFIKEDNYYHLINDGNTAINLAFRYDTDTAFYIENPTQEDLKNFSGLLNISETNFLYLQQGNNVLFANQQQKAFYFIHLLTENDTIITKKYTKGCVMTTKESVKIIAERFIERSLFDGREKEKRYLKQENWYTYDEAETEDVEHPLQNKSLKDIGKNLTPSVVVQINLKNESFLQSPQYYESELTQDYSDIKFIKNKSSNITQVEKALDLNFKESFELNDKIFVILPYTDLCKKKLKELSYNYRFLDKNEWYISIPTIKKDHRSYFVIIRWEYNSNYYGFNIKGYNNELFKQLIKNINLFGNLLIVISRPMKRGERVAKSLTMDYNTKEKIFMTSFGDQLPTKKLISFLNSWID